MAAVSEIANRIAAMQIVGCRLAHEQVCWERGRILRRRLGDEQILVRQVCSWSVRKERLACAHTSARDAAERALLELRDARGLTEDACVSLLEELRTIGHEIQLLDHRKGEAEKAYALAVERAAGAGGDPAIGALQSLISSMESEHGHHVSRLIQWRDAVLAAVDRTVNGDGG